MTGFRSAAKEMLSLVLSTDGMVKAKAMGELRGISEKSALMQLDRLASAGYLRRVEVSPRRVAFEVVDREAAEDYLNPPVVIVKRAYPCSFVFNLGAQA